MFQVDKYHFLGHLGSLCLALVRAVAYYHGVSDIKRKVAKKSGFGDPRHFMQLSQRRVLTPG